MNPTFTDDEVQEMREALGLPPVLAPIKDKLECIPSPRVRVVLSVRKVRGGIPRRFEHVSNTLSLLEAEIEASRAAREAGLFIWGVIEVVRV